MLSLAFCLDRPGLSLIEHRALFHATRCRHSTDHELLLEIPLPDDLAVDVADLDVPGRIAEDLGLSGIRIVVGDADLHEGLVGALAGIGLGNDAALLPVFLFLDLLGVRRGDSEGHRENREQQSFFHLLLQLS